MKPFSLIADIIAFYRTKPRARRNHINDPLALYRQGRGDHGAPRPQRGPNAYHPGRIGLHDRHGDLFARRLHHGYAALLHRGTDPMTVQNFIFRHLRAAETERQLHFSGVAASNENRRRREAEADADLHRTHVHYLQKRIKRLEQQLDQAMWGDETDR